MTIDTGQPDDVPSLARNPVSIVGVWVTTLSVFAFLTYLALEAFGLLRSPYSALFGYIVVPACFILGLLIIPVGIWIEGRRRRRGQAAWRWPVLDFADSRTRGIAVTVLGLTVVNLAIVAIAASGAVHYSESDAFCGGQCHVPMEPEASAHPRSAHSQVNCVACHVGPGVSGAVEAKMNGTRQLIGVFTGNYSRPIPSPRDRMPVPAETCNRCHGRIDPERMITRVFREHKDNEASTEIATTLLVYAGKAHWHAREDVVIDYVAEDKTLSTIPYVKMIAGGRTEEFFAEGATAPPAGQPLMRMTCIDCHNRPAHTLAATPGQVVDRAIVRGEVSTKIPFVRSEMVDALAEEHPPGVDAPQAIAARLSKAFGDSPEAKQAVQVALRLYGENVFPRMNVTWGTYTNQLFHVDSTGCFRCHDDGHKVAGGGDKVISQDCEFCHKEQ